jgi:DNA-nicking Smr family endonuclease
MSKKSPKARPPSPERSPAKSEDDASSYKPFAGLKALRASLPDERAARSPAKAAPSARPPKVPASALGAGKPAAAKLAAAPLPSEDELSMHRLMSGVKPLEGRAMRVPRSQAEVVASEARAEGAARAALQAQAEADAVHAHLRELVDGARRFEVSDDGRRVEGRRLELRNDVLRKLRHGQFAIDARIDLHGMSSSEAREALERFLADKRARGERCVLVIHGKGEHSPGGVGVLRGEISAWLSQGSGSTHVAAFATAGPGDGGEGAVYVLLTH